MDNLHPFNAGYQAFQRGDQFPHSPDIGFIGGYLAALNNAKLHPRRQRDRELEPA